MTKFDDDFMEILACPHCHGKLRQDNEELLCDACRLAYPVVNGIPDFLPDSTRKVGEGKDLTTENTEDTEKI